MILEEVVNHGDHGEKTKCCIELTNHLWGETQKILKTLPALAAIYKPLRINGAPGGTKKLICWRINYEQIGVKKHQQAVT